MTTLMPEWNKLLPNEKASPKRIYNRIQALIVGLQNEQSSEQKAIVIVAVNVSATNSSGSSAADPLLIDGTIIGITPTGNQDQLLNNVEIEADGKVKVTLAVAATAQNNFQVAVMKA